MNILLIAAKAISLVAVAGVAFLALAMSLGADLTEEPRAKAKCAPTTPTACLFMIV